MEFSARGSLNAVTRPQGLRPSRQFKFLKHLHPLVVISEADVIRWVPILCGYYQIKRARPTQKSAKKSALGAPGKKA